jgi:aspartyl-tRNA(Asn)/glutamyl-tRNA(Gln) amidotransferase subunit A
LTPTVSTVAPRIDEVDTVAVTANLVRLNHQWSLGHLPALAIPCGITGDGLPFGLQLAGRPWEETVVLRAGIAFQSATDWHLRRPALAAPARESSPAS